MGIEDRPVGSPPLEGRSPTPLLVLVLVLVRAGSRGLSRAGGQGAAHGCKRRVPYAGLPVSFLAGSMPRSADVVAVGRTLPRRIVWTTNEEDYLLAGQALQHQSEHGRIFLAQMVSREGGMSPDVRRKRLAAG